MVVTEAGGKARGDEVDAEALGAAWRQLRADPSIQFDLPAAEPIETPAWMLWLADAIARHGDTLRILFWVAVGLAGIVILWLVARRFAGERWPWARQGEPEEGEWRPAEAPARALLAEADALAAQGLFAEAAHLLLHRSIEDIDRRRPDLVRPAMTSREIAGLDAIPPRPRGAFSAIAAMVERSLFAARALGAEDWRDCRAAYEHFAFAEGWRR